jgi:transposase InsO family protein
MVNGTGSRPPRRPTPLVCVRPGLWVARPAAGTSEPETVEERVARRLARRAVFSRPLLPRGGRASDRAAD